MTTLRTGVLLSNLGTPDGPDVPAVRQYLREFLMDPYVIDIPWPLRWFLVNALILPRRPRASAHAYQQVWTERGSPLLFHSEDLLAGVRDALGPSFAVELGMRYGAPSIPDALDRLLAAQVDRLLFVPLYPQYSLAATETGWQHFVVACTRRGSALPRGRTADFYADDGFIAAFESVIRDTTAEFGPDHVLFSFHGLPERHVKKTDLSGSHCLASAGCCDAIGEANRHCYRAQSMMTARLLAARLGLGADGWSVSFQSRLGRTPWIRPFTDEVLPELAKKGVRRVAVTCPAFVADCLETLEEIAIRARDAFRAAGGEDLRLVPSLNAHPLWVSAVADLVRRHAAHVPVHALA